MTRKREPVAELGYEDFRIVRHTHDVELADRLMRDKILAEEGCQQQYMAAMAGTPHTCSDECRALVVVGKPVQVWARVAPCLPGSYGDSDGWAYTFHYANGPGPGAFRAVEFR